MKAVILAGGKGTRFEKPGIPKPMVDINGTPLLELLIKQLVESNIKEIYISIGYEKKVITNYFGDGSFHGCKIKYLIENEPLGTAGSLVKHKIIFSKSPFLVIYGDILLDIDWQNFIDESKKKADSELFFVILTIIPSIVIC